ncbi:MAG: ABC transporter permease [Planctomycetota bacterium]|jgi:ABC-type lipoprotein release transport system permease subunit
MTIPGLIFKEIRHRKTNFALGLLGVMMAVALFISFFTAAKASNRETARLMLSLGFNLHIIPKDTNMNEFLLTGLPNKTMPEQYTEILASQKKISYNHLMATLQKKITWRSLDVVLTGLAPEVSPPGRKTPPMKDPIERGNLYVGYRVAKTLGLNESDVVEIKGKTFKVAKCLAESGGTDDIRIQCNLLDAQDILGLPEQISEIQAVDCLCFTPTDDPASMLRKEIGPLLPEAQVFHTKAIASARAKTRQMVRNLFAVIVLAVMNVRDRQQEIGIMRALGYGSGRITLLFLGKAIIIGLLGAIIGYIVGTVLALNFGPDIFKMTAKTMIRPDMSLLLYSLVFAPVFAAVSSFIPAMIAVTYDPAVTLREE